MLYLTSPCQSYIRELFLGYNFELNLQGIRNDLSELMIRDQFAEFHAFNLI